MAILRLACFYSTRSTSLPRPVAGEAEVTRDLTGSKAFLLLNCQRNICNILEVIRSLHLMLAILAGPWKSLSQLQLVNNLSSLWLKPVAVHLPGSWKSREQYVRAQEMLAGKRCCYPRLHPLQLYCQFGHHLPLLKWLFHHQKQVLLPFCRYLHLWLFTTWNIWFGGGFFKLLLLTERQLQERKTSGSHTEVPL